MQAVFTEIRVDSDHRSGCPINLTLEVVGDKWSLLILRDMMFGNKRHFRELLKSEEGISSNILADRLRMLVEQGIITKADDPTHMQKAIYSLTEKGIELVPILAQMAVWGRKYLPVTKELAVRARLLEEGGPKMWRDLADELRVIHLGARSSAARSRWRRGCARPRGGGCPAEAITHDPVTSACRFPHTGSAQAGGVPWQASSGTPAPSGKAAARTAKAASPRRARR